jgi:hypothetical protein
VIEEEKEMENKKDKKRRQSTLKVALKGLVKNPQIIFNEIKSESR